MNKCILNTQLKSRWLTVSFMAFSGDTPTSWGSRPKNRKILNTVCDIFPRRLDNDDTYLIG